MPYGIQSGDSRCFHLNKRLCIHIHTEYYVLVVYSRWFQSVTPRSTHRGVSLDSFHLHFPSMCVLRERRRRHSNQTKEEEEEEEEREERGVPKRRLKRCVFLSCKSIHPHAVVSVGQENGAFLPRFLVSVFSSILGLISFLDFAIFPCLAAKVRDRTEGENGVYA